MVSVCMATKNGARHIREQIDSILPQLSAGDELIISDDASSDGTREIVKSYADNRIIFLEQHVPVGVTKNFEHALVKSKGDFIFLSDQDDVWKLNKIEAMLQSLRSVDLAICDCEVATEGRIVSPSFFADNRSGKGLLKNLFRNSYMGCCMAFRRTVLDRALPFPADIPIHDFWIGLIAEVHFRVNFIEDRLVYYRRHTNNASTTGGHSTVPWLKRLANRFRIVKGLMTK